MITTNRVTAEVRFLPVYECRQCGRRTQGDTDRISIHVGSFHDVAHMLENVRLNPSRMPIGWSNSSDGYRCAACTKK